MLDLWLGIDVGGTNTDAVVLDAHGHVLAKAKTPTTADVVTGIARSLPDTYDTENEYEKRKQSRQPVPSR